MCNHLSQGLRKYCVDNIKKLSKETLHYMSIPGIH